MSNADFGSLTLQLSLLLATAHIMGHLFARIRQPRVIGEILAGVVLGPSILGRFAPTFAAVVFPQLGANGQSAHDIVLGFVYNLGLLLLMFVSGAEINGLFDLDERKPIAWLSILGTLFPFIVAMLVAHWIPLDRLMGAAQQKTAALLVIGIAVSVTSIPVISRILHDLGILNSRFARLVLGVAVLEDVALWAVLAVATALAASGAIPSAQIARHVGTTILFLAIGMFLAPALLRRVGSWRWNALRTASPVGYAVVVLLAYSAIADAMGVSLVFAAFLAGFALGSSNHLQINEALASVKSFSFAVFVPIYFAVIGYRLDLSRSFSFTMLAVFLVVACTLKLFAVGAGAHFAGFGWRSATNLAIATNARGGPGIVLASVAYDSHIINGTFFTTLVLVAVLTSQAAGVWLEYTLRRGLPLLEESRKAEKLRRLTDFRSDELTN